MRSADERLDALGLRRPPKGPAILLYDIETAPSLCWVWSQWNTNVVDTEQDWYLLAFAYRWFGQKPIGFVAINQDPDFTPDTDQDRHVAERLHALIDAADIVVAHNGDRFDQKKAAARFLRNGLGPVSPYRSIDTLKEARRHFSHYSNALKELGRFHELGGKVPHTGFDLWRGCMRGDPKAWRLMERYNRQDVELLEAVYLKLRPWIGTPGTAAHPNLGHWDLKAKKDGRPVCPKCGHDRLQSRGYHRTHVSEYRTWWCNPDTGGCGGYSRTRKRDPQYLEGGVEAC